MESALTGGSARAARPVVTHGDSLRCTRRGALAWLGSLPLGFASAVPAALGGAWLAGCAPLPTAGVRLTDDQQPAALGADEALVLLRFEPVTDELRTAALHFRVEGTGTGAPSVFTVPVSPARQPLLFRVAGRRITWLQLARGAGAAPIAPPLSAELQAGAVNYLGDIAIGADPGAIGPVGSPGGTFDPNRPGASDGTLRYRVTVRDETLAEARAVLPRWLAGRPDRIAMLSSRN
ncbi:MAG: hypothetical protein AB7G13_15625 [Lautropia sp.]